MRERLGETWIDSEELAYNTRSGAPSRSNRRGFVRFPDGRLRFVRLGVADSAWTIPARPSHGRLGHVTIYFPPGVFSSETHVDAERKGAEYRFYPRRDGRAKARTAASAVAPEVKPGKVKPPP
jgi:hypothetical protein